MYWDNLSYLNYRKEEQGAKMKTLIVGDVHGRFGDLNAFINKQKPELVIACGDFGYWPNFDKDGFGFDFIKPQGSEILWCDGNHEDHWSLRDRKTDELVPNVHYMPRGSTFTLDDGRTILFMGGGDSIDKNARTIGIDWFPQEVIRQKDLDNLPDIKIDIVISHTCPLELVDTMIQGRYKSVEPSNHALSVVFEKYKPDLWYYGHWHFFKETTLRNTKFTALSCLPTYAGYGRWWIELDKDMPVKTIKESLRKFNDDF